MFVSSARAIVARPQALFVYTPADRITCKKALAHPYFADLDLIMT
jgi:hypothetical protein